MYVWSKCVCREVQSDEEWNSRRRFVGGCSSLDDEWEGDDKNGDERDECVCGNDGDNGGVDGSKNDAYGDNRGDIDEGGDGGDGVDGRDNEDDDDCDNTGMAGGSRNGYGGWGAGGEGGEGGGNDGGDGVDGTDAEDDVDDGGSGIAGGPRNGGVGGGGGGGDGSDDGGDLWRETKSTKPKCKAMTMYL